MTESSDRPSLLDYRYMPKSVVRHLNKLRKLKDITVEEWRLLYDDSFNKVSADVCHKLSRQHVRHSKADVIQHCELVFRSCYNEWLIGREAYSMPNHGRLTDPLDRLFPPTEAYFYTRCFLEYKNSMYGNGSRASVFHGNVDPVKRHKTLDHHKHLGMDSEQLNPLDAMVDEVDRDARFEELDFYISGLSYDEIAHTFPGSLGGRDGSVAMKAVHSQVDALAKAYHIDRDKLMDFVKTQHSKNRPSAKIVLFMNNLHRFSSKVDGQKYVDNSHLSKRAFKERLDMLRSYNVDHDEQEYLEWSQMTEEEKREAILSSFVEDDDD